MHGILERRSSLLDRAYTSDDITAVYCIRAHEGNPWVLERLRLIADHYEPRPRMLICDFGSTAAYASEIEEICRTGGVLYFRVEDDGVYSPSIAHNRAFEATTTELVFFCDIDTFGRASMFADLASLASTLGIRDTVDLFLSMPIFHLSEVDTNRIMESGRRDRRSSTMDRIALEYLYRSKDHKLNAFVVPYSNNFLIHRDFFSLVGGYDERFRGHGSEDFEFFLRTHYYSKHLPLPSDPASDRNSPTRDGFYMAKDYSGFRRLFEAQSYPAEQFGLRVFHLWHPRNDGEWTDHSDWKRERFNEVVGEYLKDERRVLGADALARPRTVLCVCKHADHWGYFAPLRVAGYKLLPLYDDTPATLAEAIEAITSGIADALAIFNPYMHSQSAFKPLFLLAQERDVQTIVVDRGALPYTIYYADDVAYTATGFSEEAFAGETFENHELSAAEQYVVDLRKGDAALDSTASIEATARRYPGLTLLKRPICFIPTQLDDDMAVTHFDHGYQSHDDFIASTRDLISANPKVLFIVKPHPLSKLADMPGQANLIVAKPDDNIHFLIDCARWVICYNSGVGLLALLHGKPTITVGNAFYNYDGAGHRATSLADAVRMALLDPSPPSPDMIKRLAAWFMLRKYSTFTATDDVREFEPRKARGYKDILVTHFRWIKTDISLGRIKHAMPLSNRSYLWARIGMEPPATENPTTAAKPPTTHDSGSIALPADWGPVKRAIHGIASIGLYPFLNEKNRHRLKRDPIDFFQNAKWPPNRFFGRLLLDKSQRSY